MCPVRLMPTTPGSTTNAYRNTSHSGAAVVLKQRVHVFVTNPLATAQNVTGIRVTVRGEHWLAGTKKLAMRVLDIPGTIPGGASALPGNDVVAYVTSLGTVSNGYWLYGIDYTLPAPVTVAAGRRLMVEFGGQMEANSTSGSGLYVEVGEQSADWAYSAGTSVTSAAGAGRGWVEFTTADVPPGPPTNVTQTGATTSSFTFTWTPPVGGTPPTEYQYRLDGGPTRGAGLASTTPAVLVPALPAGAARMVEVRSITPTSTSAWTVPVLMTTLDAPSPPTGVTQTDAGLRTATVVWTAPASGTPATSYWYRVNGGASVNTTATSVTLSGLTPDEVYSFEVRSMNGDAYSVWTAPVTVITLSPPFPPRGLGASKVTPTTFDLSWVAPTGTEPDSYEYRLNGGDAFPAGSGSTLTISGLSPATDYLVSMRSVLEGEPSLWSPPLSMMTAASATPVEPVLRSGVVSCFAPVRGSALRVTALTKTGEPNDPNRYSVSTSVVKVTVNEVSVSAQNEIISNPEDERRLRFHRSAQTIRNTVDIEFLRVDPELFGLVCGVKPVYRGEQVVGFDSGTRDSVNSFALEVWSKLDAASQTGLDTGPGFGEGGFGEDPFGRDSCGSRRWGYTLFPHLRGGRISGFRFANGLVSFSLIGAQTRRVSRWGFGPYDLEGAFERLVTPVSGNTSYRAFIITSPPPQQTDGVVISAPDVLDNGTAAEPMPDPTAPLVVDCGGAITQPWVIDGGRA